VSDVRPDRHALLELDALLRELAALRDDGDAARFDQDSRYRWVLHRLWIAVGNEALAYTAATGQPVRTDRTWSNLYDLRNHLAHSRLPDIDEGLVRRFTWSRLGSLRETVSIPERSPSASRRTAWPGHADCARVNLTTPVVARRERQPHMAVQRRRRPIGRLVKRVGCRARIRTRTPVSGV